MELKGSPLARSWDQTHAKPTGWMFKEKTNKVLWVSDGFKEFCFLSTALSAAGIHPLRLEVSSPSGYGLPPLLDSSPKILQMNDIFIGAYKRLQFLTIGFAFNRDVDTILVYNDLKGLGRLLNSLSGLESLDLNLPPLNVKSPHGVYNYDQIFVGTALHLPRLHTFKIHHLAIHTKDLIILLTEAFPGSQSLSFDMIWLLDGQ